jgi:hypothetical protein
MLKYILGIYVIVLCSCDNTEEVKLQTFDTQNSFRSIKPYHLLSQVGGIYTGSSDKSTIFFKMTYIGQHTMIGYVMRDSTKYFFNGIFHQKEDKIKFYLNASNAGFEAMTLDGEVDTLENKMAINIRTGAGGKDVESFKMVKIASGNGYTNDEKDFFGFVNDGAFTLSDTFKNKGKTNYFFSFSSNTKCTFTYYKDMQNDKEQMSEIDGTWKKISENQMEVILNDKAIFNSNLIKFTWKKNRSSEADFDFYYDFLITEDGIVFEYLFIP